MAYETVGDAITEIAQNISLVNGQGMTPYSDDLMISLLQQANHFIRLEQIWDEMVLSYTRTLDGTTGRITLGVPSTEVSTPLSIFRVFHESSIKPLPRTSARTNPLIATAMYGYGLLSPAQDPGPQKLLLQFSPITLTGSVYFQAKAKFDFTDRDLVIPVDFWLHVWRACYQYAQNDGTNPGQIDSFKDNYNNTLKLVKDAQNSAPISADPYRLTSDTWWESDDPYWISGS